MKKLLVISLLPACAACATSQYAGNDGELKKLTEVLACWPRTVAELEECGMRGGSHILSAAGVLTYRVEYSGGRISYLEITPPMGGGVDSESLGPAFDVAAGSVVDFDFSHDRDTQGEEAGLITIRIRRAGRRQLDTHIDEMGNLIAIYLINGAGH